VDEVTSVQRVRKLYTEPVTGAVEDHAQIVKRHAHYRQLLTVASTAMQQAIDQEREPDEIAGALSMAATKVVTGTLLHNNQTYSYSELGSRWTRRQNEEIAARAAGMEIGVRYGIKGIDDYVKGQRPGELMIIGGDPGVGKSALAWAMARNFALRQAEKPEGRRIATLVWSGEMAEDLSSTRFAQIESRVPGDRFRQGEITRTELRQVAEKWATHRDLPLYVNHSGFLRESQVKAMVIAEMRRGRNIGLFVIDHFRFIRPDEKFTNRTEAEDQVVAFLAGLAKDLNICVVCLAHTKVTEDTGRRPTMDDLRGSKMISAFAALVGFPYWPYKHASQRDRDNGMVSRQDYEMIWDKVRQGSPGTGELYMDLSTMTIH
jgi:replicative DNA helicase